ncbi:hypothetical protein SHDE107825_04340 [Shewanella denitrificans]
MLAAQLPLGIIFTASAVTCAIDSVINLSRTAKGIVMVSFTALHRARGGATGLRRPLLNPCGFTDIAFSGIAAIAPTGEIAIISAPQHAPHGIVFCGGGLTLGVCLAD